MQKAPLDLPGMPFDGSPSETKELTKSLLMPDLFKIF
jgi:hypothetical protein